MEEETRGFILLDTILQDLRQSGRTLRRSPGFTLIALLTLALSIAATASLFSVIDATLLAPLSTPDASRLIWIDEYAPDGSGSGGTPLRLADWQRLRSFESVAGFYDEGLALTDEGPSRRVIALRTFGPVQKVLHASILVGRAPTPAEARGAEPAILLTARLWRTLFHAERSVLGHVLHLGGKPYPVIGVIDGDVRYPEDVDVWIPAPLEVQGVSRQAGFLGQVARLASGTSIATAQAELDVVSESLAKQHPETDRGRRARITPLQEHVVRGARTSLLTLFGAIASVFLVACLNVAGLLLARGLSRTREAGVRLALGAGRLRLVRLFLTEGLLLSVFGGACGLGLAWYGVELLKRFLPADMPRLANANLNGRTVVFVGVSICIAAVLCGLIPAIQIASRMGAGRLNELSRGIIGPRERLRGLLVIAEVAASLALLVTAGLLGESYFHMHQTSLGFRPDHALSFAVPFAWDTPPAHLRSFSTQALERLASLPGIQSAGIVDQLPLHGGSQSGPLLVRGSSLPASSVERSFSWRTATAGYFEAAGVPMIAGEMFREDQSQDKRHVVVVNRRFAKLVFHGANPVGREIAQRQAASAPVWFRIVGLVGDTRQEPSDLEAEPEVYVPWGSTYWPMMNFVVRTLGDASNMKREIEDAIQPLAPEQTIQRIARLQELTDETEAGPRGRAWLLGCFAVVATVLGGVGIFGLLTQEVARRTPELGLRLALGAAPGNLFWETTLRGLRLVAVGLVAGTLLSMAAQKFIEKLIFASKPTNLPAYFAALLVLLMAAFVASVIPSIRAARIQPVDALRQN